MGTRGILRRGAVSLRSRLALTFLALVLLFGAGTLGVTYLLVAHVLPQKPPRDLQRIMQAPPPGGPPPTIESLRHLVGPALQQSQGQMLGHLLLGSAIALFLLGIVLAALSWRIADRALRPLRTIRDAAQRLSHERLGERIALAGPHDELRDLADTFDGMLGRLEKAFADQRQFVANASHELKTPLAVSRSLLEVALKNPQPSLPVWQETAAALLAQNVRMERLISALLVLARGEQGKAQDVPLDLEEVVEDALSRLPETRLNLRVRLRPSALRGDPTLLGQLCRNLLENAARYNRQGGYISILTAAGQGGVCLRVSNSGPIVPPDALQDLLLPFHRLTPQRTESVQGAGLGLAICDAVVKEHGGSLTVKARHSGGLTITVRLPQGA